MPVFNYECKKCKHNFELYIRGNEQARCPTCSSTRLIKAVSKICGNEIQPDYVPNPKIRVKRTVY